MSWRMFLPGPEASSHDEMDAAVKAHLELA